MMLAGWPGPKPAIAWGMAAKFETRARSGLRARSRAAQWKNEGPMKQVGGPTRLGFC